MNLTTMYFTNTSNFEEIVETIRTADDLPDKIDGSFLEDLGYSDPADLLILRFFKIVDFINEDDSPSPLLEKFRQPESSKEVFAQGVINAYEKLFDKDPTIHKKTKEDIIQLLQASLDEKKSNIIIGYMANTFKILVDYVGEETITNVLENGDSNEERIFDLPEIDTGEHDQYKPNGEQQDTTEEKNEPEIDVEVSEPEKSTNNNNQEADSEVASMSSAVNGMETDTSKEVSEAISTSLNLTMPPAPETKTSREKLKTDYINKAYIKKADLLYRLNRLEEALPVLDKVYERFAESEEDQLKKTASVALIKKMDTAERLELNDYLISIYSEVIDRLEGVENSDFIPFVDHAYVNISEILYEDDQHDKALNYIKKAIERFKKTEKNTDFLAKAMYLKADLLEKTGSDEEALKAFEDFLDTYGDSTEN